MSGHALIVGGSRGIGAEIATQGYLRGWTITTLSRSAAVKTPPGALHLRADVSRPTALMAAQRAVQRRGLLDALILCQRYRGDGDPWVGELSVSLGATKTLIEGLAHKFSKEGGAIVVVGSLADRFVAAEQGPAYHAAKAALAQLARYYAVSMAPKIRVNSVVPGLVLKDEARDFYKKNARLKRLYEKVTPLGRLGRPKDVAEAAWFLCERRSSFITGQELIVDGGLSLGYQLSLARRVAGL